MQAWVKLTCPYCGHTQQAIIDMADFRPYTSPQVVNCDCDEGGCDKWYVFEARATFAVTTGTIGGDLQPEQPKPEAPQVVAPDWSKAPEWAQWWAVDASGEATWFRDKPYVDNGEEAWSAIPDSPYPRYRFAELVNLDGGHWYRSLTQRPQEVQP